MAEKTGTDISRYVMNVDVVPFEEADRRELVRVPSSTLASLGSVGSSLAQGLAAATEAAGPTVPGAEGLYRVVFADGVTGTLAAAKDGSGYLGTILNNGIAGQARLIPVESSGVATGVLSSVNPAMIFMAASMANVEARLSSIERTQREILCLMEDERRAEMRAWFTMLADIHDGLRYNADNPAFRQASYVKVLDAGHFAEKTVELRRARISQSLDDIPAIHTNADVRRALDGAVSDFEEYRAAVYLLGLSSMMGVVLVDNYADGYLDGVKERVVTRSNEYRYLYTDVYDKATELAGESIGSRVIGAIPTRLGDMARDHDAGATNDILAGMRRLSAIGVTPFVDAIDRQKRLYEEPTVLYFEPASRDVFLVA